MKGFIFAAGFGERLRPLTNEMPKSLLPVLNLPSICYAVFLLKEAGIDQIICNLHYRYQDIIYFFRLNNNFGLDIKFSIEETILGTGGGLKKCADMIGDSDVLLLNSDVIIDLDLISLIICHRENKSPATLVLKKTDEAQIIGPVSVDRNRITDFKNFLGTNRISEYIYTGAGIVSPVIFDYLVSDFSSVVYTGYVELIKKHFISFYEHTGYWQDIGTIDSYWKANIDLMNKFGSLEQRMLPVLGIGPSIVFPDREIKNEINIRDSVIGKGATIGDGAVIETSVLLPGSVVKKGALIRDSVVFRDRIFKVK
ncbi:MAG: NDP-sugar synthase [Spirochaetota bacterium]